MENNHKEILFNNINDLIVEEGKGPSTDNSVVQMTQKKMDELKLFKSETVLIKGRKRKKLVLILLPDDSGSLSDNKVRLNEVARRNLGVNIGDLVNINKNVEIPILKRVKILPIKDSIEGISGNLTMTYLIPYFRDAYRPVTKGEIIRCGGTFNKVEFQIMDCEPDSSGILAPYTIIFDEGEPINREDIEKNEGIGYADFGGYENQLISLRNMVELSLLHTEIFNNLGIKHSKGIILHGPHGVGKTLLAKVICNEIECFSFFIDGNEIISKDISEAENDLKRAFIETEKNMPSIIFIDNIDLFFKKRNQINREIEMKFLSLFISLFDSVKIKNKIIIIGTVTKMNDIPSLLRIEGRFEKEIEIGIPNENDRLEILKIIARKMKLNNDVNLKKISALTENFIASELVQICNDAGYLSIMKNLNDIGFNKPKMTKEFLDSIKITEKNFIDAIKENKIKKEKLNNAISQEIDNIKFMDKSNDNDVEALKKKCLILEEQLKSYQELFNNFEENKKKLLDLNKNSNK